jgi:ferredoxin
MRAEVRIDYTRCRGHAICSLLSDTVELDRWGYARTVDTVLTDPRRIRRARRSAAACPNGAIVVTEVEDGQIGSSTGISTEDVGQTHHV